MLYTRYVYFFQAAGLVLLVAMIGAIVLTLRHKPRSGVKTSPTRSRAHRASAIEVVKVQAGAGALAS